MDFRCDADNKWKGAEIYEMSTQPRMSQAAVRVRSESGYGRDNQVEAEMGSGGRSEIWHWWAIRDKRWSHTAAHHCSEIPYLAGWAVDACKRP